MTLLQHPALKKQKTASSSFQSPVKGTTLVAAPQNLVTPLPKELESAIKSKEDYSNKENLPPPSLLGEHHNRSECKDTTAAGFYQLPFQRVAHLMQASASTGSPVLNTNFSSCVNCCCYVCDVPINRCKKWAFYHCNAYPEDPMWRGLKRKHQEDDRAQEANTSKLPSASTPLAERSVADPKREVLVQLYSKRVKELKHDLKNNGQHTLGRKADLVDRILDAKKYGCLGGCPDCLQGKLKLVEHSAREVVVCIGFSNKKGDRWEYCDFCCMAAKAPRCGPWKDFERQLKAPPTPVEVLPKSSADANEQKEICDKAPPASPVEVLPKSSADTKHQAETGEDDLSVKYGKLKVGQLKDLLRLNGQHITGAKKILVARLLDGVKYGRLDHCPECGHGRLRINDSDPGSIFCPGYYHSYSGCVVPCDESFKCSAEEAPRLGPWRGSWLK